MSDMTYPEIVTYCTNELLKHDGYPLRFTDAQVDIVLKGKKLADYVIKESKKK